MFLTSEKRSSFMQMMGKVAKRHGCQIEYEMKTTDPDHMTVHISDDVRGRKTAVIYWPEVSSLTEVAVEIWANYFDNPVGKHMTDPYMDYIRRDIEVTKAICNHHRSMTIKDVIFSPPATIVFWLDGTKTVVKCQDEDKYDPEKGLAMAIAKKAMGNNYSYYNTFKHWLKKWPRDYVKHVMKTGVDPDIAISGSYFSNWASRMAEIFNINKEN